MSVVNLKKKIERRHWKSRLCINTSLEVSRLQSVTVNGTLSFIFLKF
jgi:hypothetical protein